MGSFSRKLRHRADVRERDGFTDSLAALAQQARDARAEPLSRSVLEALRVARCRDARESVVTGWKLALSVHGCDDAEHWHLRTSLETPKPVVNEADDLALDRILITLATITRSEHLGDKPLLLTPVRSRVHHFSWHSDGRDMKCRLMDMIQDAVTAGLRQATRAAQRLALFKSVGAEELRRELARTNLQQVHHELTLLGEEKK